MARRSLEADRLEELLSGQNPPDEAPRQLARLVALAATVRDHTSLEAPSDDFRAQLRQELLAAPAAPPSLVDRARDRVDTATARWRHSLRVAGVSAVASAMIGTTGMAAAAQSALPGDVLYSLKGLTEDARLAFASGDVERGRLHLAFARERLEEIEQGRDRLHPEQFIATLDQLDREAVEGADEMLAAASAASDAAPILGELDTFTAELRARLVEVTPDLPLSVHPATERTLELLRRIDLQVTGLLTPTSCEACGDALPHVVLPGEGPAAPSCDCVGGHAQLPAADPGTTGVDSGQPGSTPDPTADPTAPLDPVQPGGVPSDPDGELDDDLGDLGTNLEDTVDDLGSNLDTTVDDLGTDLDTTVDDLSTNLDTTVDDLSTDLDTTVGGIGTLVDDLLGSQESVDASSSASDSEDGLLGGLLDQ